MSKKQWLVLLMLFLTYLLLGASMFYHIERGLEVEKVREARINRIEINALLHDHYVPNIGHDQDEILEKLTTYCGKSVFNYTENEVDLYKWDFYNSFYFAYTVVSTIGYGNLAPTNMLGRILMIFYALIGIPMNGILLAQLGEFFGNVFVRAHKKYKSYKDGHSDSPKRLTPLETGRAGLAAQIFMYLAPGFVMFIFFPAFLFSYYEGWHYDESVYYAFVTLTTIGFGDYVAGQDNTKGSGVFWIIYKIFLIIWISFGLGYLVMIMSFIARGMRSKRITRLEHKLAMNLKQTQNKILNEFNKDVNYLRRVFNEIYLMKIKPVYRDNSDAEVPLNMFPRSLSFPDLRQLIYGGMEIVEPIHPRRRANSEVAPVTQYEAINRAVSETDLQRIDKKATFASHAIVQPAELLARLVNALGYIPPSDDFEPSGDEEDRSSLKGVEGFSDKDILASERAWAGSGWRLGTDKLPQPRARAASEIRLEKDENVATHQNAEWTWSGPAASRKIQELIKARRRSGSSTPNKGAKTRIPSLSMASVPKTIRPRWFNPFASKKNSGELSRRNSLSGDNLETHLRENYLSHTANTGTMKVTDRRISATPHYFTHTGGNLPNTPDVNLLEETSLADFLRALTALHSRVGAVPEDFINKPQRKMGTASLTPPKLPSLLALFSPPPGYDPQSHSTQSTITAGKTTSRRFSLRPADNSGASTPGYERRGSLVNGSSGPRRFSLRPEENSGTSTPIYQRRASLVPGSRPRRFSLRSPFTSGGRTSPLNTPPYTPDLVPLHVRERQNPPPYSADPFVFECPKEPLVRAEVGPAQDGIPLSVRATPVPRRFSLRPAQIGVPPAPASPKPSATGRPVPKWKGGMLQRQISELNLQRRVRAFSLGDVNSIKNDRTVGQTSPLALPNATSNLSSIFSSRTTPTTENIEDPNSQSQTRTLTTVPSGTLSSKTINDSRQTTGSIDQSSTGQSLNDKTPLQRMGLANSEQGFLKTPSIDLTLFAQDQRTSDKSKISVSQTSNPFRSNFLAGQSAESSTTSQSSGTHRPIPTAKSGGILKPFSTDPSRSLELQSVVVDKPSSESDRSYSTSKRDSLTEVKVIAEGEKTGGERSPGKSSAFDFPVSRKVSTVSQQSATGSVEALRHGEKSVGRKISTLSEQSIELGSISGSRKSSTSRSGSGKPRVSIESYKPLTELRIEKPATNPFEQYKATVECMLDKPRDRRSLDSQKTSTEIKGDAEAGRHRHSSPDQASVVVQSTESYNEQNLVKKIHKNPEA